MYTAQLRCFMFIFGLFEIMTESNSRLRIPLFYGSHYILIFGLVGPNYAIDAVIASK